MEWKKAAYLAVDCLAAAAKSRIGPPPPPKKTENRLPAVLSRNGTPAAVSASATSSASAAEVASRWLYRSAVQCRSVLSPAATEIGFPDSVPAW